LPGRSVQSASNSPDRRGWRSRTTTRALVEIDKEGIPADAISSTYDLVDGDNRYRIIDAKFYRQTLGKFFDAEKVHSANLYQMTSYLMNAPAVSGIEAEGMLIYPKVDRVLRERYNILGRKISVCTVDLDAPWWAIDQEIRALMG